MFFWGKPLHSSWAKPNAIGEKKGVAFRIISKDLIYRGSFNRAKGDYQWIDTLEAVPKTELQKYDPVPAKVLDYVLLGVYTFDKNFKDIYYVLYYSKKRHSMMQQMHSYEPNRIEDIMIYGNGQVNPFIDVNKYFKLRELKDSIYKIPVKIVKKEQ